METLVDELEMVDISTCEAETIYNDISDIINIINNTQRVNVDDTEDVDVNFIKKIAVSNPEIRGGDPVFKDTRLAVETVFDYIVDGLSIDDYVSDHPNIDKNKVIFIFKVSKQLIRNLLCENRNKDVNY